MTHIAIIIMILALTLSLGCTAKSSKQQSTLSEKLNSFGVGAADGMSQ
jgi:hypothetical protein